MTCSRSRWIVLGLLVPVHILLTGWLACCLSPTSDEIAHLAAGIRIWKQEHFDLYLVNPPLVKAVASWPVAMDAPQEDWQHLDSSPGARPEWLVGADFLKANTPRFRWDFVMARWACLPFTVLGLLYCFRWGEELFGPCAGLLSALLWCFSPNILGNAALLTPDVPATAMGVAACFHVRRWWLTSRWDDALLAGLLLGLAELAKMTWLILYGLLPALWLLLELSRKEQNGWQRRGFQLVFLLFISLDVLNAGYLFDRSLQPLKEFDFVSELLSGKSEGQGAGNRFRDSWLGEIPTPVPAPFLIGFDLQRQDFEGNGPPLVSYLRGELRSEGWWYYYLYGLLIKVPLGTWLIALCCLVPEKNDSPLPMHEWILLLAIPVCLFVVVSSQTGFSRYVRYVLPIFPFLFIALGSVWRSVSGHWSGLRAGLAGVGLCLSVGASLSVYPYSLSFFNRLAGGPARGHWHLLDSNVDWGQDLYFLRDWMDTHPEAAPFYLAYSGVANPQLVGVSAEPFPESPDRTMAELPPGWYAISVNHLHGYDGANSIYAEFLKEIPVGRAGYSIFIYHLPERRPR